MDDFSAAMEQVRTAVSSRKDALKAADTRLAEIDKEIKAMRDAPISLADFETYVRNQVAMAGQSFAASLGWELMRSTGGRIPANERSWISFEREDGSFSGIGDLTEHTKGTPFEILAAVFPNEVAAKLAEKVIGSVGAKWGNESVTTVAERRTLIETLETEKDALIATRQQLVAELRELSVG